MNEIKARYKIARDTSLNWESNNPILLDGEEILVDISDTETRKKIGDGSTHYNDLPFSDEPIRDLIDDSLTQAKDYADALIGTEQFTEKYSSNEIVVGQWIDDRPIYRKTFTFSGTNFSSSYNWVRYHLTTEEQQSMNIDFYINIRGMAKCTSTSDTATGSWQPIPRICPDAVEEFSIGLGDLTSSVVGVLFGSGYTGANPIYLICDYVKKTS